MNILYEREYSSNEQQLLFRCINLIQGRIGSFKVGASSILQTGNMQSDISPIGDEGCDMNMSCASNNSIDLCSPDRIDIPSGWIAPAPPIQPILQSLRMYVPEMEEIRMSPIVARKGTFST